MLDRAAVFVTSNLTINSRALLRKLMILLRERMLPKCIGKRAKLSLDLTSPLPDTADALRAVCHFELYHRVNAVQKLG